MPKNAIGVVAVIAIALLVNVAVLIRMGGPLFVTYVPNVPEGITCQGCDAPQIRAALAEAAAAGRAQIQRSGEGALWWGFGLIVINIAAPIIAWRLGRGSGSV